MRIRALAVLTLTALAGCGGGRGGEAEKVRDVMERLTEAIARGDGEAACRDLTPEARRLVVTSAEAAAGGEFASCGAVLGAVAYDLPEDARRRLHEAEYSVELHGDDTAIADSQAVSGEARLRKHGGRWIVTRLTFGS